MMKNYKVVGQGISRVEGPGKVTGVACYAADIQLPGMLWAKVLHSPLSHV